MVCSRARAWSLFSRRIWLRDASHDLWMAFLKDTEGNTLGLMSEVARAAEVV